ncbi:MAG: tetratricopeptide repeat protein [bacterium]
MAAASKFETGLARAEQGYADGQRNLGVSYENGRAMPQDDAEAVRLYRLAAEQGYGPGLRHLGNMYLSGEGVPQDDLLAYMWFNLAASRLTEFREAVSGFRDTVGNRLTPDQRAEAQRLAREWDEAHPDMNF